MTRYYLTDDSCEPLDIDALGVMSGSEDDILFIDWTYDSTEDLIADLERKIKEMKWKLNPLNNSST